VRRPAYVRQVRVVERRRVAHPVRVVRRTRIVVHDRHPRIAHRTVTRVRYSRPAVTRRVAIHND
jgi:hypothetical protein